MCIYVKICLYASSICKQAEPSRKVRVWVHVFMYAHCIYVDSAGLFNTQMLQMLCVLCPVYWRVCLYVLFDILKEKQIKSPKNSKKSTYSAVYNY